MPGIVRRRENRRNGIASGGGGGGGGVARRSNNANNRQRNRNRNRNRGRGGNSGAGDAPVTDDAGNTPDSGFYYNTNADAAMGWDNFWKGNGIGIGAGTAFDNWFKNDYYNTALAGYRESNAAGITGSFSNWNDYLRQNYTAQRLRNDWLAQSPITQQLLGAGQARWQSF